MDDLNAWCKSLYEKTRNFQGSTLAGCETANRGFALFYAPPMPKSPLLLGLNPRRVDGCYPYKEEAMSGPPNEHLFASPRARKMHGALVNRIRFAEHFSSADIGRAEAALMSTNKINQIPFGSKDKKEWLSNGFWPDPSLRKKAEQFSAQIVDEVIANLRPTCVICEGFGTYDWWIARVKSLPDRKVLRTEKVSRGNNENIRRGLVHIGGIDVETLGIPHPTGARTANAKKPLIGDVLVAALNGVSLSRVPVKERVDG